MNIILLSGGSGKRLWPLSNEVRSKQFLKIFRTEEGTHESMVQRMYRMIREVDPDAKIIIATSQNQLTSIYNQIDGDIGVSIEPCRRDTFPAIALATAYLHDVQGVPADDTVVVCPVDPYVDTDYFEMLRKLGRKAGEDDANLVLMGIEPDNPSEKYGYIIPSTGEPVSDVISFKEKPDKAAAETYISKGALWNGGVFAYKLRYVLNKAEEILGTDKYRELYDRYPSFTGISFDYAVAEKEKNIRVMRFNGLWKDLGTWNTLTEAMQDEVAGKARAVDCVNTHVINELQIPLIALGTQNLAIAATPDGILVTEKDCSDRLKDYVIEQRPMYEKRYWGEYQVLDYRNQEDGQNFLTKRLIIRKGKNLSYQKHYHRTEIWTVVDGTGWLVLDDMVSEISRGNTAYIKPGMKHAIKAETDLHIIEVQIGDELTENDISRLDWDWSSVGQEN